jgi:hypothetical protein
LADVAALKITKKESALEGLIEEEKETLISAGTASNLLQFYVVAVSSMN